MNTYFVYTYVANSLLLAAAGLQSNLNSNAFAKLESRATAMWQQFDGCQITFFTFPRSPAKHKSNMKFIQSEL